MGRYPEWQNPCSFFRRLTWHSLGQISHDDNRLSNASVLHLSFPLRYSLRYEGPTTSPSSYLVGCILYSHSNYRLPISLFQSIVVYLTQHQYDITVDLLLRDIGYLLKSKKEVLNSSIPNLRLARFRNERRSYYQQL